MEKSELITLRTTKKVADLLEKLTSLENRKISDEARLVMEVGIKERLKQIALERYMKKEVTLEKAAEIAEISVWEMVELLENKKIPYNLDIGAITGE